MSRSRRALRLALRGGLIVALAAATAACGGGGGNGSTTTTTTTTPVTSTPLCDAYLEQFGLGFCQRYKTAANTQPIDANSTDITPTDLTKQPIEVPAGT